MLYEFEYKKKYEESIFSHLDMYMIKHFLIEINKIVETISSLDQETSFSLKEAISDVSKKIPDDLSVSVE